MPVIAWGQRKLAGPTCSTAVLLAAACIRLPEHDIGGSARVGQAAPPAEHPSVAGIGDPEHRAHNADAERPVQRRGRAVAAAVRFHCRLVGLSQHQIRWCRACFGDGVPDQDAVMPRVGDDEAPVVDRARRWADSSRSPGLVRPQRVPRWCRRVDPTPRRRAARRVSANRARSARDGFQSQPARDDAGRGRRRAVSTSTPTWGWLAAVPIRRARARPATPRAPSRRRGSRRCRSRCAVCCGSRLVRTVSEVMGRPGSRSARRRHAAAAARVAPPVR